MELAPQDSLSLDSINKHTRITDNDLNIINTFSDGQYARSGTMLAGSLIVGHIHKNSCINIMSTGKMIVNFGGKTELLEAPCVFKSDAGTRKVLLILEDVTFTNVHNTYTTDLEELREELVVKEDVLPDLSLVQNEITDYYKKLTNGDLLCG